MGIILQKLKLNTALCDSSCTCQCKVGVRATGKESFW